MWYISIAVAARVLNTWFEPSAHNIVQYGLCTIPATGADSQRARQVYSMACLASERVHPAKSDMVHAPRLQDTVIANGCRLHTRAVPPAEAAMCAGRGAHVLSSAWHGVDLDRVHRVQRPSSSSAGPHCIVHHLRSLIHGGQLKKRKGL